MLKRSLTWCFYINNGSIERRYRVDLGVPRKSSKAEILRAYPFNHWYGKGTILKVVPEDEQAIADLCPANASAHHLGNRTKDQPCFFCGAMPG